MVLIILASCTIDSYGPLIQTRGRTVPVIVKVLDTTEEIASGSVFGVSSEGEVASYPDDRWIVFWPPSRGWGDDASWSVEDEDGRVYFSGATGSAEGEAQQASASGMFSMTDFIGLSENPLAGELWLQLRVEEELAGAQAMVGVSTDMGCVELQSTVLLVQEAEGWGSVESFSLDAAGLSMEVTEFHVYVFYSHIDVWGRGVYTGSYVENSCELLGSLGSNCAEDARSADGLFYSFALGSEEIAWCP